MLTAEGITITEATLVQTIQAGGAVVVGLLALFGIIATLISNRGRQHSKAALEQVQNNHKTNLRDDLDKIRDLMIEGFAAAENKFADGLKGVHAEVALVRQEALAERTHVNGKLAKHDEAILELSKAG